jgi:acyl-CoA synthetase (AMP-forming)/AMP-acid ligase II/acyl carrier protein
MLVDSPVLSECRAVRQVVVGGEQLSGELAADLARRLPVPLHNLYGPTETTIDVSSHTCLPGIAPPKAAPSEATPTGAGPPGPVPIGRPLAGARLYVLDQAGGLAPLGVIGHLHAGGVPVGRGYPGRPALTAERFVPDPFGPPGSRLYRTGDLARWTGDGDLQFMGRIDAQVKIRGLRVEPAEVEAVLREQPGVRDAAVLVRDEGPGDQRLVAYVLAEAGAGPLGAALRAALRRSLPDYLVPAAIVSLGSFPLTSHGKLDVAWLPAPDYAAAAAQRYQEPQTASERLIAGVWAEVLGLERVGSADDFFDLGGHSLLAARIAVRLTDLLGTQVPIHLFFSHVTVRDLAAAVEELMAAEISELSGQEVASMLQELQT